MKIHSSFFLAILITLGLSFHSCNKVKPTPPERTEIDSVLSVPMAYLNIPIRYSLDSLQSWLNTKIRGEFVNQAVKLNSSGDSLYIQIEKIRAIRLSIYQNKIRYVFPVRVKGQYVKYFAGIRLTNDQPVETDISLIMSSKVSLQKDWTLKFETKLDTIHWEKEPVLKLGRLFEFNLKSPLEKIIYQQQDSLLVKLDQEARENIDIHTVVEKIWGDIQKPILLHKKDPPVYLKIQSQDIAGDLVFADSRTLLFDVALSCNAIASMEKGELPLTMETLPPVKPIKIHSDSSSLVIKGVVSFDKINRVLKKQIIDFEFEKSGYKVKITNAEVYGTHNQSLAVMLDLRGSINGRIYMVGKPVFDMENTRFWISDFRYDLDTENQLVSAANAVFKESILVEVTSMLYIDLKEQLGDLPDLISDAIEKGKAGESISLNIESLDIRDWKILITKNDIQFALQAKAKADIELKNFRDRKRIRIGHSASL